MFGRYHSLIPIADKPVPVLVKFVSVLLKDVQEIASPEKRVPRQNEHKSEN